MVHPQQAKETTMEVDTLTLDESHYRFVHYCTETGTKTEVAVTFEKGSKPLVWVRRFGQLTPTPASHRLIGLASLLEFNQRMDAESEWMETTEEMHWTEDFVDSLTCAHGIARKVLDSLK